jgi:hypothetical protein
MRTTVGMADSLSGERRGLCGISFLSSWVARMGVWVWKKPSVFRTPLAPWDSVCSQCICGPVLPHPSPEPLLQNMGTFLPGHTFSKPSGRADLGLIQRCGALISHTVGPDQG